MEWYLFLPYIMEVEKGCFLKGNDPIGIWWLEGRVKFAWTIWDEHSLGSRIPKHVWVYLTWPQFDEQVEVFAPTAVLGVLDWLSVSFYCSRRRTEVEAVEPLELSQQILSDLQEWGTIDVLTCFFWYVQVKNGQISVHPNISGWGEQSLINSPDP